ncbi:LytTR family DNA-binding domain-containing protein [Pseudoflavonifractor intestinihominis]|uniref:Stage 0 sporulation protein A homolog n=1 Tax=Pseudoflavonifractor intestinihominis TaxID=3133171 RepID=A0ABV1E5E3_9FIRM|nr:LytTR family DNA-binding domain-containing protein [uncultured Pseudoflavonifractor sp.]
MIRIALVEDEESYVETLRSFLSRYERERGERLQITVFSDGDEIALGYRSEYDVILMDIEMRFMDGMTAAEEIRKVDPEVIIIFITNSPQYAIKGYAVDALDYVLKPLTYFAFSQRIDRALERLGNRARKYLTVSMRGGTRKLDVSRLWFVEVRDHDLIYHTDEGLITTTGTMREAEKTLGECAFFRCNKGYLVNLEHVDSIREDSAVVHGEIVQVSRARKKAFLDALNNYLGEVSK